MASPVRRPPLTSLPSPSRPRLSCLLCSSCARRPDANTPGGGPSTRLRLFLLVVACGHGCWTRLILLPRDPPAAGLPGLPPHAALPSLHRCPSPTRSLVLADASLSSQTASLALVLMRFDTRCVFVVLPPFQSEARTWPSHNQTLLWCFASWHPPRGGGSFLCSLPTQAHSPTLTSSSFRHP